MKQSVYSGIYEVVTEKLDNFRFSKESYLNMTENSPHEADVVKLLECDNCIFLECAYLMFLQRPIDEKAFEGWKEKFSMNENEFRNSVINTLINSQEFANASVTVKNNIYASNTINTPSARTVSSAVQFPDKLLRIYRKQPEFVKKAIKHIVK